jgi:hypothetical protein
MAKGKNKKEEVKASTAGSGQLYTLQDTQQCILEMCFTTPDAMERLIAPFSNSYEGTTSSRRMGHNFPIESATKAQVNSQELTPIRTLFQQSAKRGIRYIIAYLQGDHNTRRHELRHALFFVDNAYKATVEKLWDELSDKDKERVTSLLTTMGYDKHVHIDEFQAYCFTEQKNLFGLREMPRDPMPSM